MKVALFALLASLLVGLAQATECNHQEGREDENGLVSQDCTQAVDPLDEENEQEAGSDEENEQEAESNEENEQEAGSDEEIEQLDASDGEAEQEAADVMDGDKVTLHVSGPIVDAVDQIATFSEQVAGAIEGVIPTFPGAIGDVIPDVPGVIGDVIPAVPIQNVAHLFTKTTLITKMVTSELTTISTCYKDNEGIPNCPRVRRTVASFQPVVQTVTTTSAHARLLNKTRRRRRRSQETTHTPQLSDIDENTVSTSMPALESSLVSIDEPMEVRVPIRSEKAVGLLTMVTEIKENTITKTVPHPEYTVKLALEGCRPAVPITSLCEDAEEYGTEGEESNDDGTEAEENDTDEENGEEHQ